MTLYIDTGDMDREDWLMLRRSGIGASDVAALAGLSPWATPMSIWLDKTGQIPPDAENERMRWGHLLEDAIADEFTERTGLHVIGRQMLVGANWFHLATIDGFAAEGEGSAISDAVGLVEIKNTGLDWDDEIPAQYQCQVQWQMHVTDTDRAWIAALFRGSELRVHEVARDDRQIGLLVQIVDRFWNEYVVPGEPPPVDGAAATTEAIKTAWGRQKPTMAEIDLADADVDLGLLAEWRMLKASLKVTEEQIDEIENEIKLALTGHDALSQDGKPLVTWKAQERRGFDHEGLMRDNPSLYASYETKQTIRVLRPTKNLTKMLEAEDG